MSTILSEIPHTEIDQGNVNAVSQTNYTASLPITNTLKQPAKGKLFKIVKYPLVKVKNMFLTIRQRNLPVSYEGARKLKLVILAIFFLLTGITLTVFYNKSAYFKVAKPTISLVNPKENQIINRSEIYVSGSVTPIDSQVVVNGKAVSENGNGGFTAIIGAEEGKNIIKIEAINRGRKAEVVRIIDRQLTEAEIRQKEIDKQQAQVVIQDRVLGVDQKIEELLATYNSGGGLATVRVVNHEIKHESAFQRISGEVINNSSTTVYWVKITAVFYGPNEDIIETKYGFAVSNDESLAPGAKASFITQSTAKDFHHYKLTVDWKSEVTPTVIPTPDGQTILEPSPTISVRKITP